MKNLHHEINDDEKCQYENLNIVNGFHLHHFNVQGKMIPLYVKLMQTQETYNISDNVSRDEVVSKAFINA